MGKGNVENKVGYERKNMFVPGPTILDFDLFNKGLFDVCEKDAKHNHYVKNVPIEQLFEDDRNAMLPLNKTTFGVYTFEPRIADKYAKVSYDNNLYSSSPKYARDTVYVKATCNRVFILNQSYELISENPRLYGNGLESMKWLPYLELMAKRPTALKYTSFYEELPDNWRKYLGKQDSEGRRRGLASLHTMLQKHDMRTAIEALSFALDNGVQDADSILASYRTITADVQQLQPMQLKGTVIPMLVFHTDNNKYDNLFQKEVLSR